MSNSQKAAPSTAQVYAKAIIQNQLGKILILQRSFKSTLGLGQWDLPGGTLEVGESPLEGLLREVKEETDLKIYDPEIVFSDGLIPEILGRYAVVVWYKAKTNGGAIKLDHENCEYKWIDPQEALDLNDSFFQNVHRKALEASLQ